MDAMRIGDADREEAVALLGEQYALGRLSKDEYDERSDAAWSARTQGDLAPLFADLPLRRPAATPPEPRRRGPRLPVPLIALLVLVFFVAVVKNLPILLLLLLLWFFVGRRYWPGRHHRSRRGNRHGGGSPRSGTYTSGS